MAGRINVKGMAAKRRKRLIRFNGIFYFFGLNHFETL